MMDPFPPPLSERESERANWANHKQHSRQRDRIFSAAAPPLVSVLMVGLSYRVINVLAYTTLWIRRIEPRK